MGAFVKGTDVNAKNGDATPLFTAGLQIGSKEMMEFLAVQGAEDDRIIMNGRE